MRRAPPEEGTPLCYYEYYKKPGVRTSVGVIQYNYIFIFIIVITTPVVAKGGQGEGVGLGRG